MTEYLKYAPNSKHIQKLKKKILDEDLRYYLIGLTIAVNSCYRKLQEGYRITITERAREARELSKTLNDIICELDGSLNPDILVQKLERDFKKLKSRYVEPDSGLKTIYDIVAKFNERNYLTKFGKRIETRLLGGSYNASYSNQISNLNERLEFIDKQNWSDEDKKMARAIEMDLAKAKIFEEEESLMRGAMLFEIKN